MSETYSSRTPATNGFARSPQTGLSPRWGRWNPGGFLRRWRTATSAQLSVWPSGVAVDGAGNLYIADTWNYSVRRSPAGIITTVAGNAHSRLSFSGDGGPATSARLDLGNLYNFIHSSVAVDSEGNLYIADAGNNRIRRVSVSGIITTVAGSGTKGFPVMADPLQARSSTVSKAWRLMARATCSSRTRATTASAGSSRPGSSPR